MSPLPPLSWHAEALWLVIGFGLVAYALTGGADLGAGVWDLFARGPRREQQREAARHAIAPIWEANHVWLIFIIVVMFSAFPRAFSTIATALHVPIGLALVGLVFRGAAFAFHAYGIQSDLARAIWARLFAWSSLVAPVFLGCVVAALGSGDIELRGGRVVSGVLAGWSEPFGWAVGVFSLVLFAMLAACYLAAETQGALRRDFIVRAVLSGIAAGACAFGLLVMAKPGAPMLFARLVASREALAIHAGAAVCAFATLAMLARGQVRGARFAAAAQVALVVLGWGRAMDHHFILPGLTMHASVTQPAVLPGLLLCLALGALVLVPSLVYLLRIFKRDLSVEH